MVLEEWFQLKAKQFHRLGYDQVTSTDIASFFFEFAWKRKTPNFYTEQVNAIVRLTPNQYFDFRTMQIQTNQSTTLEDIDFSELF
ncbi:hypothetical protein GMA11_07710 [Granulicatella sp. zg-ZJ]|uniref:post-transcriptional regulator n=1 Tax=Granulicatella sp. zg-ZJ TaxID=2678504 RepID=UPI0013D5A155|nr:post-transcriptional regulator [Granulicatella sp. zg-ZJ]NEW63279.1 hypothetical protein [Granulicatella sp. zg-ZJ]